MSRLDPRLVWLQRLAAAGTTAAWLILAASALLRLSTSFATDGLPVSTLALWVETSARLTHRVSASLVPVLALLAATLAWKLRHMRLRLGSPMAAVVVATLVLAVVGPLTPGYKVAAVTVINVSMGLLLLVAFWWLRECAAASTSQRGSTDAFSRVALAALLLHVASGAAASAWAMHGVGSWAWLHLFSWVAALLLIAQRLVELRPRTDLARERAALASLLALQCTVGYAMMSQEPRSLALSLTHALLAPALAMALTSLALRSAKTS